MDQIDVEIESALSSIDRRITSDRTPPHSDEAEVSVLGGMLLEEAAVDRAMELLGEDDFYHSAHRLIFAAIGRLRDQGHTPDALAVREELKRRDELEQSGGAEYLARIVDIVPTAANVGYHAKIVLDSAVKRRLIRTGTEIVTDAYEAGEDADHLLNQAEERIFRLSEHRFKRPFTPINELLQRAVVDLESLAARKESITGVPTGYKDLDDITAGLQLADLVIVAARPSVGKCLAADSEIVLSDGSLRTIEEIVRDREAELLTLGGNRRLGWTSPSDFVDDGIKPTFRVRTRNGREIETTISHPFLTRDGWEPLAELVPGVRIAVPRETPVFGREAVSDEEIEDLAADLSARPGDIPGGETEGYSTGPGGVECQLPELDVAGEPGAVGVSVTTPTERSIPDQVFRLPRRQLALFLRRLFGSDEAEWSRGRPLNTSERAARQVQHLLTRFGVTTRVSYAPESGGDWRVEILEEISNREASSHIHWDEIVAIDYVGEKQVYDLTIPDTHNFVANDVCVHNTSLATCFAANAAIMHDLPVAIFSLEMSTEQLVQRMISMESMVSLKDLRTGHASSEQWKRVADACDRLRRAAIYIDDTGLLTPMEMRAKARRLKQQRDIGMVIVDYLQLMETGRRSESRQQEITEISRSLKALAKELNIPVVALSQLSRAPEQRTDQRPRLSDLRECVTGDTIVVLADGSRTPIRELVGTEPEVLAIDDLSRVVRARADKVWRVGVRPVFDVRLASGRRIRATARHRLFTGSGWQRVEDIASGDRLAIARSLPEPRTPTELRFLDRVGAFGPRVDPARELRELLEQTIPNTNVDTLPRELFGRVRKVMRAQGFSQRAMAAARGTSYGGTSHFRFAPSRAMLSEYAEILDDDVLREQASSDLFWDRVVEILPAGEEEVFDLTVPGPANWLADGIVSHNSGAIEQDADMVLFLYRDKPKEDEIQERAIGSVTEIIIGKNRNGPTGSVDLVFLEPYMRFEDLERHRSMT